MELTCFQDDETRLNGQLHKARARVNALQLEANEELPAGLAGFEEAKAVILPNSGPSECY